MSSHPAGRPALELRPAFPVLDPLRAVGALAVFTTHAAFQGGEYLRNGTVGTMFARLDIGVAIFFVLSGFLLSRPYLASAAAEVPLPSARRYYIKRFWRITPLYLVTVVAAMLAIPENAGTSMRGWLATLTLSGPYVDKRLPQGLTQMWSLAAEVAFYAVLPVLMWLVLRNGRFSPRRVWLLVAGLFATTVVWVSFISDPLEAAIQGTPGLWLPAFASWFAAGIALALLQVQLELGQLPRPARWVVELGRQPGVCWALVAGLFLMAATPLAGPVMFQVGTHGQVLTKQFLYAIVGTLIVMTGIFGSSGVYARVMSSRLLRHLGHISYGIFCVHLVVLSLIYRFTDYEFFAGDTLKIWPMALLLSIVAAEILYRVVELPGVRLGQRGTPKSAATQPAATQQAATTST
ncbi:acyltransferase [Nocardioides sp.]|uniref:acyltransferase family protein n=1 Tax=Nocardioides sp. TaxID=35761 RepID=UPI002B8DE73F|nr:acyltransferase [Nocardioides sp.]HXH79145.1 acyltransferase [Nocardioides sp.]